MVNPLIKAVGQAAKKPIKKGAEEAISKAAESAGMKAPVVAQKDLTTLQDSYTSLGDRIRMEAELKRKMMEGFDYKYDKGQRVFTEDSAAKNKAPYEILFRTRTGNQVMREDHPTLGPGLGRPIIDPETGRARRTPYEPGYRVRSLSDEGEVYEFEIPASAIKGDVEMARGGKVYISSNPDTMRMELEERRLGIGGFLGKTVKGAQKGVLPAAEVPPAPRTLSAGDVVNGLTIRKDIPNTSSIGASLTDYSTHGLQEVPMSAFDVVGKPRYRNAQEEKRTKELARQIQQNKELNPLIVVKDAEGYYILEGGHRFDALRELDIDSFPALVVHDLESLAEQAPVAKAEGGAISADDLIIEERPL